MTAMAATIMAGLIVLVLIIKPRKSTVDLSEIQQQLSLLGEQQEALTAELQSVREAQEFQAQLLSPPKEDMTER
jgi:hypothetical protein